MMLLNHIKWKTFMSHNNVVFEDPEWPPPIDPPEPPIDPPEPPEPPQPPEPPPPPPPCGCIANEPGGSIGPIDPGDDTIGPIGPGDDDYIEAAGSDDGYINPVDPLPPDDGFCTTP